MLKFLPTVLKIAVSIAGSLVIGFLVRAADKADDVVEAWLNSRK